MHGPPMIVQARGSRKIMIVHLIFTWPRGETVHMVTNRVRSGISMLTRRIWARQRADKIAPREQILGLGMLWVDLADLGLPGFTDQMMLTNWI